VVLARKRMASHKEEMKAEQRQPKAIVIRCADRVTKRFAVQLRRREMGHADLTQIATAVGRDLKRVAVDQLHGGRLREDQIVGVDIPDDVAALMKGSDSRRGVASGAHEK